MSNDAVQTSNKPAIKGKWQILVFVCLSVFLVNGFIYTSFNLLTQTIATELGWTGEERALVASGISTGMIWFVFIAGLALDKFSVKKLLGSFMLICAVLVVLRGVVTGATVYFAVMFIFGACFAMLSPANTKLVSLWFGQKDIAVANGALTSASPLGQLTGNLLSLPIIMALGGQWSRIFWLQGILLAILGICVLLFAKERRNIDAELSSNVIQSQEDLGIWKNIKGVARVPQFWLYIIAHACFLGMIYGGGTMSYIVLQVDTNWGLLPHQPGIIVSFNNFSSMCMYVIAPLLIRKFFKKNYERSYRRIAIFCGLFAGIVASIGWRSGSFTVICTTYLLTGIVFGQIVPVPKVLIMKLPEVSGARSGTALGVLLTLERVAQTIITAVVGMVIARNPENGAVAMSYFSLLYLVSPILIFVVMQIDKKQGRLEETPKAVT